MSSPSRLDRMRQHYAALLETAQSLNRVLDFNELLQLILGKLLEITSADCAVVALADESGEFQFIGGLDARRNTVDANRVQFSPAIVARLSDSRSVVCIREVARDSILKNDLVLGIQYTNAVIACPMLRGDAILGIIYLTSRGAMLWVDDLDLSTVQSMAAQLSLAMDSAIAFDEVSRMQQSFESELQDRTAQLTQANSWLADALREAEKKLSAQAEIEHSRSRYYSTLSHELRSPTQLLLGHAYIALDEGSDHLTPLQRESLDIILKTCEHLRNLVTKVVDANKLTEGAMTLEAVAFDIRPLIDETLALCRGLLPGKAVQLFHQYPSDLPQVLGDVTRIRQVLLNLLANACRFTDQGKIIVSAGIHSSYVVVSVTDTGTGIPSSKIDTIFEPFTQADSLRSHGGSGLGLAITKQLVDLHGGKLWVKSVEGQGSTFFFSLPIVMH